MKIAVVAALVAPVGTAAAYGDYEPLIDLATGLARRGHRVRLYAAEGSCVPGVELVECSSYARLFRRLRADGADAVSQHAFDAEAIALAAGLPVLHTLHMPPIVPAVTRALAASGAAVAAVSSFAAAQWRSAGLQRVHTIPNGVPDFTPLGAVVQPVALIAGRSCREKGSAAGIRAALRAGLHVRMHERLPRRDLWQLMAQCAVCLMPIDGDEPFSLVAAEAQIAGCPVVGYARGALPEIVQQEVSGILVPPGDEAALAPAIRRALTLDRPRVRESGRARLLITPMLERYEAELRALARRQALRAVGA
jgi:hypothetical protein